MTYDGDRLRLYRDGALVAEVEVVSRDRGEYYIKGATLGAPQAIQVADRWHLLHNLHETMTRVVERFFR